MRTIYTIGYTKKCLKDFIERLRHAGIDCVVDVRRHNTSQLAGFSKKDDLEYLLTQGFDIDYVHMPDLAPSEDILSAYKSDKNWKIYELRYRMLMDRERMAATFMKASEQADWQAPCLLCAEDKPDKCHRRLLAEAIAEQSDNLEVSHL
ncbi:MAG: DUF488 domain-containing protein [Armatimonadota bacterium]